MLKIYSADIVPLESEALFEEKLYSVSAYRREKILAFKNKKSRLQSLCAGLIVDEGLKIYGLKEKDMAYGTYKNGKPYFINRPDIYFNISHSEEKVFVAFSDSEVGADIEKIEKADIKIAKRFFHHEEYEKLMTFTDEEKRNSEFFRVWVLKESFIKFTGQGMKLSLDKFVIHTNDTVNVSCGGISQNCVFYEIDSIPGYKAAVCSMSKEIPAFSEIDLNRS